MSSRRAYHAGSWYSDDRAELTSQLDRWMRAVPDHIDGLGALPIPGARIIIAPHAGYDYSGKCAAFAYKALDLSQAKRIFVLGPSHHHPLSTLALPELSSYRTPLSSDPLPLDTELISKLLSSSAGFKTMSPRVDEREHSLELHLPYIHRRLQLQHPDKPTSQYPPLVPIMVGSTRADTERAFGSVLAPYLKDPTNVFVISSDFCHWGHRFSYTYFVPKAPKQEPKLPLSFDTLPQPPTSVADAKVATDAVLEAEEPKTQDPRKGESTIYDSISAVDIATMKAITTGQTKEFLNIIRGTGNTVCGRHPIGVIMAALEEIEAGDSSSDTKGKFHFLRYERSSDPVRHSDSSVSYVSAVAII